MNEHSETWDLIPWLVNGRADGAERQRAEAHLRDCPACRSELDLQQRLQAEMVQRSGLDQLPSGSFQRLMAKIDTLEETSERASLRRAVRSRPSLSRWLMAAVIVESIGLMFLSAKLWRNENPQALAAPYHTVTSPTPAMGSAVIRAVFSPQLPLQELQNLLDASHLKIVSGPTEAGVYSLALPSSADPHAIETALRELRAQPSVRFAEPVAQVLP